MLVETRWNQDLGRQHLLWDEETLGLCTLGTGAGMSAGAALSFTACIQTTILVTVLLKQHANANNRTAILHYVIIPERQPRPPRPCFSSSSSSSWLLHRRDLPRSSLTLNPKKIKTENPLRDAERILRGFGTFDSPRLLNMTVQIKNRHWRSCVWNLICSRLLLRWRHRHHCNPFVVSPVFYWGVPVRAGVYWCRPG